MTGKNKIEELESIAAKTRLALIEMFGYGKAHHFGGSLSCVEILTCLYFYKMKYGGANWRDPGRDRFIMSKGHSVPTQYVMLSMLGIIPAEELKSIKTLGSRLQGHPDIRKTPGIEACTGSLGQGLSVANGMAMAGRMDKLDFMIYVLAGDGELQEGQLWEAAMTTAHYGLNNICLIVDCNEYQSQGKVDEMMRVEPLKAKWEGFGWRGMEVDGHSVKDVCEALDVVGQGQDRPTAIVARTIKGKGVSFLEKSFKGHNYAMSEEEHLRAKQELLEEIKGTENGGG